MQIQEVGNVTKRAKWMQCPNVETEYPGLAYIYPLGELIVAKTRDAHHDVLGDQAKNSYTIFNNQGQKVFVAVRDKTWKKFTLKIYNNYGNEVIEVKRPFRLCLSQVLVWAPPGHFAGSVEQDGCNKFTVKNQNGRSVLKIRSSSVRFAYDIRYVCGIEAIGVIRKPWPDQTLAVKNFGVSFPMELDVRDKAVLLGACFLIGCLKY
ncbi:phospholipid scramblase 1-like [Anticarsia gemmatalis]|uniref:phospholipid scramblase 1-like n=1 Tax=Anticarsia gemmatalis TaxID=129554 RepID=UPI003F77413F